MSKIMSEIISNENEYISRVSDGETYSETKFDSNGNLHITAGKVDIESGD